MHLSTDQTQKMAEGRGFEPDSLDRLMSGTSGPEQQVYVAN
jgi:hypothetical protein